MTISIDIPSVIYALRFYAPGVAIVSFSRDKNFVAVSVARFDEEPERIGWIEYDEFKKLVAEKIVTLDELGDK